VTVYVALLRAINVGGKNRLAMTALRSIVESVGYTDAVTYVQSGNVVFRAGEKPRVVRAAVERAIAEETGLGVTVVVRTAAEWARVVAANPYPEMEGTRLHVTFTDAPIPTDVSSRVVASAFAPERFRVNGREIYLSLPDGIGRSKLATALDRALGGGIGTTRNWNTVVELHRLTASL